MAWLDKFFVSVFLLSVDDTDRQFVHHSENTRSPDDDGSAFEGTVQQCLL